MKRIFLILILLLMLGNLYVTYQIIVETNTYQSGDVSTECFQDGGCGIVADSQYSELFGVRLTTFGMIAFSVMSILLLLILFNIYPREIGVLVTLGFIVAPIGAITFILIQHELIGALCRYCMIVDVSTLIASLLFYIGLDNE